jgi:prolyl-tRNA synthetase
MKNQEKFDEWYHDIVEIAELCDKRYPVKGMNIWRPYGWKIMLGIDKLIRDEMERTGHHEVYFPLLIPESYFKKEADHIKGFSEEVYWVTHAGKNVLDEKLLLRPTSETAIYSIFSLWVRSHTDLPLKTFQIVNTFRYETKMTKAFIRVREIHFFEAHTCHENFEDAERQIQEDITIAQSFFKKLCLPFLLSRRPDWDKFAGADYSIGLDVLLPSMKTLQVGSFHQYKQNFSKPFTIKYEGTDGKHYYCHQTTYGMSERVLGGIVGIHGEEKGIKLPSSVAPIKVVIIPIIFKGWEKKILSSCNTIREHLETLGVSCHIDDREKTPGNKFYDWETKGVPARIEIGPKDIEHDVITLVTRDGQKKKIGRNELDKTPLEIQQYDNRIYDEAEAFLRQHVHVLSKIEHREGIIELPWCGQEKCGKDMEEQLDMKSLGIPMPVRKCDKKCAVCSTDGSMWLRLAKTY